MRHPFSTGDGYKCDLTPTRLRHAAFERCAQHHAPRSVAPANKTRLTRSIRKLAGDHPDKMYFSIGDLYAQITATAAVSGTLTRGQLARIDATVAMAASSSTSSSASASAPVSPSSLSLKDVQVVVRDGEKWAESTSAHSAIRPSDGGRVPVTADSAMVPYGDPASTREIRQRRFDDHLVRTTLTGMGIGDLQEMVVSLSEKLASATLSERASDKRDARSRAQATSLKNNSSNSTWRNCSTPCQVAVRRLRKDAWS